MAPSVWAQAKQLSDATNAPPPPDVWATPLDPQGAAIADALPAKAAPSVWAPLPEEKQPTVTLAPQKPTPEQQQINGDAAKLAKFEWQDQNPWGTANNHPGKLGKVAHVFSTLGNIAGDIFAPGVMARIPGTQLSREVEEGGLAKQLNTEQQTQSENDLRGAQAKNFETEDTLAPGKAQSAERLQGAETDKDEAAINQGPDLATAYAHAVNQAIKNGADPAQDPIVQHLSDAITAIQKQPSPKGAEHVSIIGDDNKPTEANYHPDTGKYTDPSGQEIKNPRPIPPQPNYGQMILPTKTATFIDPKTGLPTEFQWNEKTQTYDKPIGMSATNAYGHEAAQAGAVERAGDQLISDLEANKANLGTLGAWVKKYGLNTPIADPTLAGIQSQLASFAALNPAMHGARGAQAMQHFQDIIGGAQQNPDATIAAIRGIMKTAGNINPGVGGTGNQSQTIRAIDPQGKLHEAPAGTPLPKGWKLQ